MKRARGWSVLNMSLGMSLGVSLGIGFGLGLHVGCVPNPENPENASDAGVDAGIDGGVDEIDPRLQNNPYPDDQVLQVKITLDPDDWDTLLREGRAVTDILGPDCLQEPFESPFADYEAKAEITSQSPADGAPVTETFSRIHLRKKGFFGSLSNKKPSLKLDLNDFDNSARFAGRKKLTFNNVQQDPSYLHTCLSYQIFGKIGIPAPRCSFADVTVNGEHLGLYVHVEDVDEEFIIARNLGGATSKQDVGNLYEGTLSDFSGGFARTFEKKTNTNDPNMPEIDELSIAVQDHDTQIVTSLSRTIDLDAFYRFWVGEVLVGHWDGYSGNQNNFFVYRAAPDQVNNPVSIFLPWGADATMLPSLTTPFQSVNAQGIITRRLYQHPDGRAQYERILRETLERAWDENAILAQIDAWDALIDPYLSAEERDAQEEGVDAVRTFVQERRSLIINELDTAPPVWDAPFREIVCGVHAGSMDAQIETTYGTWPTGDSFTTGTGTCSNVVNGSTLQAQAVGAAAGVDVNFPGKQILFSAQILDATQNNRVFFWIAAIDQDLFHAGRYEVDDNLIQVTLYEFIPSTNSIENRGRAYSGVITLDRVGTNVGDPVEAFLFVGWTQIGF